MTTYTYRALDGSGRPMRGAREAESVAALEQRLRAEGVWMLEARPGAAGTVPDQRPTSTLGLTRPDQITFFVQMSLLLKAGVTMPNALERLKADFSGTRLGRVVAGLHDQVAVGVSLHQAMTEFPRAFPAHVAAMVAAGEASGELPDVFENLSGYYEWLEQLASDLRQALIYPALLLAAASGLVLLLFTFVVPRFAELLEGVAGELPAITRAVMSVSAFLAGAWPLLLAAALAAAAGLKVAFRSPGFACRFDRALLQLPVFGPLLAMFALARFAQNLAILCRARVPLLRGLEITRELVGNAAFTRALDDVRAGLQEGVALHRGLAAHALFPPTLVTMIATGESSGRLEPALQNVARYYNKLIPRRIKLVCSILDPAIMLVMIGLVAVVALAVILPVLQLWEAA